MNLIFEDKVYVKEQTEKFNNGLKVINQAIKLFEKSIKEKMNESLFYDFIKKPFDVCKQVFYSKQTVPANFKRQMYLDMLELPEQFYEIQRLLSDNKEIINVVFYEYKENAVCLTDKAYNVIEARNIYLDGEQTKVYELLKQLTDISTELHKLTNGKIVNIFDRRQASHIISLDTHHTDIEKAKYTVNAANVKPYFFS